MKIKMKILKKSIPYILFQRTAYLKITHSLPYRGLQKLSPVSLYKPFVSMESVLRRKAIEDAYVADMTDEYENIKKHLPQKCNNVLDIGCGIGVINAFINNHYEHDPVFHLLDKSQVEDNIFYLFNDKGAFYNSLELARTTLVSNGIVEQNIVLCEANDKNEIPVQEKMDLIISLISWGFHYPLSTYLNQAYDALTEEGTLILDVRKGEGAEDALRAKFMQCKVIDETKTRYRFLCLKK